MIGKAEPSVTPIVEDTEFCVGDALPEIDCESAISGIINWVTELAEGLAEGENNLEWMFTPDDTDNYEIVTGTMAVNAQTTARTPPIRRSTPKTRSRISPTRLLELTKPIIPKTVMIIPPTAPKNPKTKATMPIARKAVRCFSILFDILTS